MIYSSLAVPAALANGVPESSLPGMIGVLFISPALLVTVPGIPPAAIPAIVAASNEAQAYSYSFLWYTLIAPCVLAIGCVACLKSVAEKSEHPCFNDLFAQADKHC